MQHRLAFVRKIQPAEFDFAFHFPVARHSFVFDLRLLVQNFVEANQRRCPPLKNSDNPP